MSWAGSYIEGVLTGVAITAIVAVAVIMAIPDCPSNAQSATIDCSKAEHKVRLCVDQLAHRPRCAK